MACGEHIRQPVAREVHVVNCFSKMTSDSAARFTHLYPSSVYAIDSAYSTVNTSTESRIIPPTRETVATTKDQNADGRPVKPRRGRRSTIPPEQREQNRRLKKQNMERRRRACISDKLNALHSLVMNLIGVDPKTQQKTEKADILTTCHKVLESVAKVACEQPSLQSRLCQLRSHMPEQTHTDLSRNVTTQSNIYATDLANDARNGLSPTLISKDSENHSPITQYADRSLAHSDSTRLSNELPIQGVGKCVQKRPGHTSWGSLDSGIYAMHETMSDSSESTPAKSLHFPCSDRYSPPNIQQAQPATFTPLFTSFRSPLSSLSNFKIPNVGTRPISSISPASKQTTSCKTRNSPSVWRPYL